jgi:4-amino-4-deoxy-L-arabinose transferase-like glycosyltransferase
VGPDAPQQNVISRLYYPSKAPLVSFLGAPVYWVLTKFGPVGELSQVFWSRLFVTIIPALLLLVLLRRFLAAYVEAETADLFTVVYALGTMAFSYAEAFMSHQLTAVLLFAAFFCAWRVERGEWKVWGYALAGLAASAAVVAEYTASLGVVSVAAYTVAARWKKWPQLGQATGLVIAGAVPLLAALLWYHQATFGSPFVSGYKFLNDAGYMHWHQGGFLGIKVPDLKALGLSYFSPLRGLFALSPFLAVAFFGLKDVRGKDRALFSFLVVLLVLHSYFTSSFSYDSWGWTVGPRHLTGMVPFLMLPLAMLFDRLRAQSPLRAGVVAGLAVSSVIATVLVCFINYVPDDVSTSVWALAVPILSDGYWPVSSLVALIPNPVSGGVLVVLLVLVAAWLLSRFHRPGLSPAMFCAVVVHLGALRLVPAVPGDPGAKAFIESVWLAPRGKTIDFRGR